MKFRGGEKILPTIHVVNGGVSLSAKSLTLCSISSRTCRNSSLRCYGDPSDAVGSGKFQCTRLRVNGQTGLRSCESSDSVITQAKCSFKDCSTDLTFCWVISRPTSFITSTANALASGDRTAVLSPTTWSPAIRCKNAFAIRLRVAFPVEKKSTLGLWSILTSALPTPSLYSPVGADASQHFDDQLTTWHQGLPIFSDLLVTQAANETNSQRFLVTVSR